MTSQETLRIVVGVDFSDTSLEALRFAFDQAFLRIAEKPTVHAVVVIDDGTSVVHRRKRAETLEGSVQAAFAELTELVKITRAKKVGEGPDAPSIPATIHVRIGDPVDQVVSVATEVAAHMVVVGTHGRRGVRRLILGSVAERVARMAPCPVMVVRPRDLAAFASVVEPEPAPEGGIEESPQVEQHQYSYSSPLGWQPPAHHML